MAKAKLSIKLEHNLELAEGNFFFLATKNILKCEQNSQNGMSLVYEVVDSCKL